MIHQVMRKDTKPRTEEEVQEFIHDSKTFKEIIGILNKCEINEYFVDRSDCKNYYTLMGALLIVFYDQKLKEISIAFHVSMTVEWACYIVLQISKQLLQIKDIKIVDSFILKDDGTFKSGKDAYVEYDEMIKENAIKDYQQEQMVNHILCNMKNDDKVYN